MYKNATPTEYPCCLQGNASSVDINRRVIMTFKEPPKLYQCPKCYFRGTKAAVKGHLMSRHGEHAPLMSPVWNVWEVKA